MTVLEGLRLTPTYHERVWGGQRLRSATPPIGEAWIVHEENRIADGPQAGQTLARLTAEYGEALLGRVPLARTGDRFPLLIKILDAADWLSVQVHPNDQQAVELAGPGHFGKTEAWHILEAAPGAQLIAGLKPGTTPEALTEAIRAGTVTDLSRYLTVDAGDTVFIGAGTLHALGPGLLLYEVQQTSDITYRVFDWDRPQSAGRALHIEQSLAVTNPAISGEVQSPPPDDATVGKLVTCPYFTLEQVIGNSEPIDLDTGRQSFHALTVIEGTATVAGTGWRHTLGRFDSVVVPAAMGKYQVRPDGACRLLKASVV
ncbi:MAG TPA: type I phosphomannose isomerase catalytic subunit [Thermomicrobiales bacterium]|jgi:mannose-6-phosphate isomerase